jgi:hypothetical protein
MFLDAFTIGGVLIALVVIVATMLATGCCRNS